MPSSKSKRSSKKARSVQSKSKSSSKKARSVPTKRTKKKESSSIRKTQSAPVKPRSTSEPLKRKAESIYPRFTEPSEIEMDHLKKLYDKYRSVQTGTWDKVRIKKNQENEILRQQTILDQMKRIEEKPIDEIGFEDLPYIPGKTKDGLSDPDIILGELDCRDRVSWCSSSRDKNKYCQTREIYDKYIHPCKVSAKVNKDIYDYICEMDVVYPRPDTMEYEFAQDMKDLEVSESIDQIMELDIYGYLGSHLSYGYSDGNELDIRIKCRIADTIFQPQLRLVLPPRLRWVESWGDDEFLATVEELIGVEEMKRAIAQTTPYTRYIGELDERLSIFEEGSLTWWVTALDGDIYSSPPNIQWGGINPKFDLLMGLEDSVLGIFDGSESSNPWCSVREVFIMMKHPLEREKVYGELKRMKNRFVEIGRVRFKDEMIIEDFREFIDLMNPYNPVVHTINERLRKNSNQRKMIDMKEV